jgi:hypothetical protein
MKYESQVMATHCVIIQNTERFGKENPITIKGEWIDWLVYFAEYKKALIELAPQKSCNMTVGNKKLLVDTPLKEGEPVQTRYTFAA